MQINYCSECRSRVSSVDIETGAGVEADGKVYCSKCAHALGIQSAAPNAKKTTTGIKTAATGTRTVLTSIRRPPSDRGIHPVHARTADNVRPRPPSGSRLVIVFILVLLIAALGILVAVLALKKPAAAPERPASAASVPPMPTAPIPDEPLRPEPAVPAPSPAAARAEVPPVPQTVFSASEGWEIMPLARWQEQWRIEKGSWEYRDGLLCALLDGSAGQSVIITNEAFGDFEFGLVFAFEARTRLDLRFREKDASAGRLVAPNLENGRWYSLELRVEGRNVTRAVIDGTDILAGRDLGQVNDRQMGDAGTIAVSFNPFVPGTFRAVAAEIAFKRLAAPAAAVASVPTAGPIPTYAPAPGWGGPKVLDPFSGAPEWQFDDNKPAREAGLVVFKGRSIDIRYLADLTSWRMEGLVTHSGTATGNETNYIGLYFPADSKGRKDYERRYRVLMYGDGTLWVKYPSSIGKKEDRVLGQWRRDQEVPFRLTVQPGLIEVAINDKPVITATDIDVPVTAGILFAFNTNGQDYQVAFRDLRLSVPQTASAESAATAAAANMIPFGDFEQAVNNVFTGSQWYDEPGVAVFQDKAVKHSGNASVRFEYSDRLGKPVMNIRVASPKIPLEAGRTYLLRYWLKTENLISVNNNAGVKVDKGGDKYFVGDVKCLSTQDWTEYKYPFTADRNCTVEVYIGAWDVKSGKAWIDDVSLAAEPAAGASETGWISLLEGTALIDTGWRHGMSTSEYTEAFTYAAGRLERPAVDSRSRLEKTIRFTEGEIVFDYEFSGTGYWALQLGGGSDMRPITTFGFERSAQGRHACRIVVRGTDTEVYIDGRRADGTAAIKMEDRLQSPLKGETVIRFDLPRGTFLAVSAMRYRSPAAGAGTIPAVKPAEPVPPAVPPAADRVRTVILQQGREGYSGCIDATVRSGNRSGESDSRSQRLELELNDGGAYQEQCYIRFDLGTAVPAGSTVKAARLVLYVKRENNFYNGFTVKQVQGPSDASLTYDKASALTFREIRHFIAAGMLTRKAVDHNPPVRLEIDITAAAADWVRDPAANYGILLAGETSKSNIDFEFWSSEYGTADQRPALEIEFAASSTVPAAAPGGDAPVPAAASTVSDAVTIDFEKGLPSGTTGKLSRRIKQGSGSVQAVPSRNSDEFAVEILVPVRDEITITPAGTVAFDCFAVDAGKVRFGFTFRDAAGREGEAWFLTVRHARNEWQILQASVKDMTASTGTPVNGPVVITGFRFLAGFRRSEANAQLYVDNISVTP